MAKGSHHAESKQVLIDYVRQRWQINIWRSSLSMQSVVQIPNLVVPWHFPMGWSSKYLCTDAEWVCERERQRGRGKGRGEMAWIQKSKLLKRTPQAWTSLVAQWIGIHLPIQRMRLRSLENEEDPTCLGATKPVHHNWAHGLQILKPLCSRAHAPQQEEPPQGHTRALQQIVAPAGHN